MTQTIQLLSLPVLNETEDNLDIFLSLLDSMNALYKNLCKIIYLSKKNNLCVAELTYLQEKQVKEQGEKK